MYLFINNNNDINNNSDELEVKSCIGSDANKVMIPCTKRQRLLDDDDDDDGGERRTIRFVPEEENVWYEIPSREELSEEQGVEWDTLFYQREDLIELKRLAYQEVRIVELTRTEECTEGYFFHEIVVVDSKELQRIRIFVDGVPPSSSSGSSSLTCCLRGLEKRSARYWASNKTNNKKLRAKALATVLMGQARLLSSEMDLVAQLYKDVATPSVEAAQQRAAYDELEAKAIYSSGVAQ